MRGLKVGVSLAVRSLLTKAKLSEGNEHQLEATRRFFSFSSRFSTLKVSAVSKHPCSSPEAFHEPAATCPFFFSSSHMAQPTSVVYKPR